MSMIECQIVLVEYNQRMRRCFDQAWKLMLIAIALSIVAAPAMGESDSKKERAEDACVTAAMGDYRKANNAFAQQTGTVMSVETTVAPGRVLPTVRAMQLR
jgi:hypothetical protein